MGSNGARQDPTTWLTRIKTVLRAICSGRKLEEKYLLAAQVADIAQSKSENTMADYSNKKTVFMLTFNKLKFTSKAKWTFYIDGIHYV